jgi:hypothetical protein
MTYDEWNCLEPVRELDPVRDLFRPVYLAGELRCEGDEPCLVILTGKAVGFDERRAAIVFRFSNEDREAYGITIDVIAAPLRFIRWASPPVVSTGDSYDDGL